MDKVNVKEALAFKELTEEEKQKKGILGRLYGPCADFVNPTRNGRTYPDELWERVFSQNELVKEAFENGGIPGELDHPVDREEIDSSKIAIIMPEPPKKDKNGHLVAYFDILDTPNGRIAYQLAKYGYKLGISSRGTGDVDEINDSVIPETYDFKCFDLVLTPSVKDARLKMVESLDTKTFKQALTESLNKANPDEKNIMEETLDRLNITLNESEVTEDEIKIDVSTEDKEPNEEKSFEDKIKELFTLTYKKDTAPTDEEIETFIQAFVSIFPKECFNQDGCAENKEESKSPEETQNAPEEASNAGDDELIKSLQDALTARSELDAQVKLLQEQLAVSDAEANKLKEENNRYKSSIVILSDAANSSKKLKERIHSLEEELKIKSSKIQSLNESKNSDNPIVKSLNEAISNKDKDIQSLREDINKQKESYEIEIKQLKENLEASNSKIEKQTSLTENYRKFAENVANRYIESKANMLGVTPKDIKNKLPKEYDLEDVDRICENLQDYSLSMSKLPFDLKDRKIKKVQIVESKNDNLKLPTYVDDDIDDSLLELAKIRK